MTSRRDFLKTSAAAPVAAKLPAQAASAALDILILGGTGFTGPEQVAYALMRGHRVTLLNRNSHRPDAFKGKVEQLVGDLNADVSVLKGRSFDVVIDNPTTFPAWVRNVAQYLKGRVKQYIFISTISTYRDNDQPGADESAATQALPAGLDPYTLIPANAAQHYGELKAFAEKEVAQHYPGIATIIRPGLIVGPLDQSERFTYWPVRIERGGVVLAPGAPDDPMQYIDARDVAEWTVRMAEQRAFGTYNAMGPAQPTTIAELLYGIKAITTAGAQFTWVPADFLASQKVGEWINMPVWVPPSGETLGFTRRANARALAKGLTFRPLAVTAADTLAWQKTRPAEEQARLADDADYPPGPRRTGLSRVREAEVLQAWAQQSKTKHS